MKLYRRIDENGLFIEDTILESIPADEEQFYIEVPVPQGFYHPKWDGEEWVEGGQAPEPQSQEPTTDEKLEALNKRQKESENAILMLMDITLIGGM